MQNVLYIAINSTFLLIPKCLPGRYYLSLDGRGRGRGKQSPERHRSRLNTKAPWIEIKDHLFLHDHDLRLHYQGESLELGDDASLDKVEVGEQEEGKVSHLLGIF